MLAPSPPKAGSRHSTWEEREKIYQLLIPVMEVRIAQATTAEGFAIPGTGYAVFIRDATGKLWSDERICDMLTPPVGPDGKLLEPLTPSSVANVRKEKFGISVRHTPPAPPVHVEPPVTTVQNVDEANQRQRLNDHARCLNRHSETFRGHIVRIKKLEADVQALMDARTTP